MTPDTPVFRLFSRLILERRSPAFRWTFAMLSLAIATSLRWVLNEQLTSGFPFLTFFPAVIMTTFLCGLGPGIAVGIGSFLASWLLFLSEPGQVTLTVEAALAMGFFTLVTVTDIVLITVMMRAFAHLDEERKRSQMLAEQRGLMFHELQHRVSNNLATVAGLLTIQRRAIADETAKKALEDAAARINVVAKMKRLLHDPTAQEVDFGGFLQGMVQDLTTAAGSDGRVSVDLVCEHVLISRDQAIPVGLVATEILTNALEHGFPGAAQGQVRIQLAEARGVVTLRVEDDGQGLPQGFDLARTGSLGLSIARQFAQQMGGTLNLWNRAPQGTVSELVFPKG